MYWKNLISSVDEMSPDEAKAFMADRTTASYQLIDVRQPKEYQEHHLPGALLIPLGELSNRYKELDPGLETVVYCRSGARSKAACQQLHRIGFDSVYNLTGGILKWQGQTATGSPESGLDYFIDGNFGSGAAMAYSMEAGLKAFYLEMAKRAVLPEIKKTLLTMASFEDGHLAKLAAQLQKAGQELPANIPDSILEGGFSTEELNKAFSDHLDSADKVIQLAMMFEAQACDLYIRLARITEEKETQDFYRSMAKEEQKHLDKLSADLDHYL